jgi:hypothetical protein
MLKLRNFVTVALVLGVAAGIWLSDLWKGPGGNGLGLGKGPAVVSKDEGAASAPAPNDNESPAPALTAKTLRVLIRDRSYFLKDGSQETSITLDALVGALRNTDGDEDGIRLRVYRAENARVTADVQLKEALQQAEIPESAIYWSPDPLP